jgi:inhibitor of KinA sporulation pathway (predicted exonuclease)
MPHEEERIYKLLKAIDERTQTERVADLAEVEGLKVRITSIEQNTQAHMIAAQEFRLLAQDVRQVLVRDVDHEQRIGGLEKMAQDAGKSAGGKSGLSMGALGSAIVAIIIAIAQALK